MRVIKVMIAIAVLAIFAVAQSTPAGTTKSEASTMIHTQTKPTVADAEKFMSETESTLSELNIKLARAQWVQATFITDDTEAITADPADYSAHFNLALAYSTAGKDAVPVGVNSLSGNSER